MKDSIIIVNEGKKFWQKDPPEIVSRVALKKMHAELSTVNKGQEVFTQYVAVILHQFWEHIRTLEGQEVFSYLYFSRTHYKQ